MSPVLSQFTVPVTSIHKIEADGVRGLLPCGRQKRPHRWCSCCTGSQHRLSCSANSFHASPINYRVIAPDSAWLWIHGSSRKTKIHLFVRPHWPRTLKAFTDALGLRPLCNVCVRLWRTNWIPSGDGHPDRVTAIVSQNGNAYEEGLGDAWGPIRKYWSAANTREPRGNPPKHPDSGRNSMAVHARCGESGERCRLNRTHWIPLCWSVRGTKTFSWICFSTTRRT